MSTVRYKDNPAEYKRQWFKDNREKSLAYRRKWRAENKARLNKKQAESRIKNKAHDKALRREWYIENKARAIATVARWQKKNPDKVKRYNLTARVKAYYGLTLAEYRRLLNVPCFCGAKATVIDHCHRTRKVRSALCRECNIGLGMFKEDLNTLEKAVEYLKYHSQTPTRRIS